MTSIDRAVSKLGSCVNGLCKTQQNIKTTIGLGSSCCNEPICVQIVGGDFPFVYPDPQPPSEAAVITYEVASALDVNAAMVDMNSVIVEGTGCSYQYFRVSDITYNVLHGVLTADGGYEFQLTDSAGNVVTGNAGEDLWFRVLPNCTLSGPFPTPEIIIP